MPAFDLSPSSEGQLETLAARVRCLRIVRGFCWFSISVIGTPSIAIALDAAFEIPGRGRAALLFGWLASSALAGWWFVARRCRDQMSPTDLSTLIETEFSNSAERALNLRRLAPDASSFRFAGLVAVAAIVAIAPVVFVSGSGDRIMRLLMPWQAATADPPYKIVVSSGDPIVKRGRAITVSGYLKRTQPNASLPDSAAVVFRGIGSNEETTVPMAGDENSAFTLTRPHVSTDLEYRIECGAVSSDWHSIRVVDPIGVGAGGGVAITAPAYAAARRPLRVLPALADIEGLQYGRAEVNVNLDRPARAVQLEWWPSGAKAGAPVERLAVALDESRTSARAELALRIDGTLKWIFFAELGVRTEISQAVRVSPDSPPEFVKVSGFPLPTQRHPARAKSCKSIWPYRMTSPLPMPFWNTARPTTSPNRNWSKSRSPSGDLGTGRLEGLVVFRLPATAPEGQIYRVRLRIRDDRSLPEFDLKPQTATFPGKGWTLLRVSANARPLVEQEAVARADQIRKKFSHRPEMHRERRPGS